MFKILNAESINYSAAATEKLKTIGDVDMLNLNYDLLKKKIHNYDILITRLGIEINKNLLQEAKNLKIIVSATTGLNHIDVEYARKKNIKILSLRNEKKFLKQIHATAELTLCLILCLSRNIIPSYKSVCNFEWDRTKFIGNELKNKTLGIIGFGRVGKQVAKYAKTFSMKIIYYDPKVNINSKNIKKIKSLKNLLVNSDIISLHINFSKKNIKFIDKKKIELFKKNCLFINTSRGNLVDEKFLIEALKSKKISGVALDVIYDEFNKINKNIIIKNLSKNFNLIVTPHIGGASFDSMKATEEFMADKLNNYLQSNKLFN
tara:strand:- start:2904 stop:3860 length:957 start_codon:yes stop_codon:yes gene_type:complete